MNIFQIHQNLWRQWVFNNQKTINMIFNMFQSIQCSRTDSFVKWIDNRIMCCWIISILSRKNVKNQIYLRNLKVYQQHSFYSLGTQIAHGKPLLLIQRYQFTSHTTKPYTEMRNPIPLYIHSIFNISTNLFILFNPPCCQYVFVINLTIR